MVAGNHDFVVEQEATFRHVFTWTYVLPAGTTALSGDRQVTLDDGTVVNVRPHDLTGCTARMHVRPTIDSTDLYLAVTTEDGGLTLGGTAGTIAIHLTGDQTDLLDGPLKQIRKPRYDILVRFPSGDTSRALKGRLLLDKNVTEWV